ncbi:hypothetical protein [Streptomyces sp. NPDC127038]|uniref:hypothetical protein n=1 Tax=Streptomyces sp. NPDC127038 TaxID=3347114 RepID=UPI003663120F
MSNLRVGELGTTTTVFAGDLNGDRAAECIYPFLVDGDDEGGDILYFTWTGYRHVMKVLPNADGQYGSIGDINGDGYGDVVLGDPTDPGGSKTSGHKGGQISVWYGGPGGPDAAQTPTVIRRLRTDDGRGTRLRPIGHRGLHDGHPEVRLGPQRLTRRGPLGGMPEEPGQDPRTMLPSS